MKKLHATTDMTVGVLHDVVEDTDITLDDLRKAGFDEAIVLAVNAVTKRAGEQYEAYLTRVKSNEIALRVKLADLSDNSDPKRLSMLPAETMDKLKAKYAFAYSFLTGQQKHTQQDLLQTRDLLKYCGHCGGSLAKPAPDMAPCARCGLVSRMGRLSETSWHCLACNAGNPIGQSFCCNCGHDSISSTPSSPSLVLDELARLTCIQNMLNIEVLKLRWALDTGNRSDIPALEQLDKYSRDPFLHEHPDTGETHSFEFWCPKTRLPYDTGNINRCPRCTVFEHQLRED